MNTQQVRESSNNRAHLGTNQEGMGAETSTGYQGNAQRWAIQGAIST